jgi:orotidine-5'-phosphate decarboxylase
VKVGKELFTAAGPALVEQLATRGFGVFLDLKFHDIPNTVAAACRAAARLGVWMLNVHASGGRAMLAAARDAIPVGLDAPRLIAVTLLTSMEQSDLNELGISGTPDQVVLRLAALTNACGLDGVVCSAREAAAVRAQCGDGFALVTPGIRPADAASDDQQRIATPAGAIRAGATYLVIGRPITRAPDPLAALERLNAEVAAAVRA